MDFFNYCGYNEESRKRYILRLLLVHLGEKFGSCSGVGGANDGKRMQEKK